MDNLKILNFVLPIEIYILYPLQPSTTTSLIRPGLRYKRASYRHQIQGTNGHPTGAYLTTALSTSLLAVGTILNTYLSRPLYREDSEVISRDVENILEKLPNLITLIINFTLRELYINAPRSLGNLYYLNKIKGIRELIREELPDDLNSQYRNLDNLLDVRYKRVSYRVQTGILPAGILPGINTYAIPCKRASYRGNPTETRYYFISRTLSD
ncbi:hypothetical protein QBC39DRAFT_335422 [Podospora conica]|nr:hypothetical protein QBC39DRAFT_335422 [Schizothecium conicum]